MEQKVKKPVKRKLTPAIFGEQELAFQGNISNITGQFSHGELGSVRRYVRHIDREKFTEQYAKDLAALLGLNEGQMEMLILMLTDKKFSGNFVYDENTRALFADKCSIKPSTVNQYFRGLVSAKKVVKKLKQGLYKVNEEFVFNAGERRAADFLAINITYVFPPSDDEEVVREKPKITLEDINMAIEIYNRQQKQENQVKAMFENKE